MLTADDVGDPRGRLTLSEKEAIAAEWNAETERRTAASAAAAALAYRSARAVAYRDELGDETGDFVKTLGDVLDVLIKEQRARGDAVTEEAAALYAKVDAIKARHPKPRD